MRLSPLVNLSTRISKLVNNKRQYPKGLRIMFTKLSAFQKVVNLP